MTDHARLRDEATFGTDDDSFVVQLVGILTQAGRHDEEACDGPGDVLEEVRRLIAEVERLREALAGCLCDIR